MLRCATNVRKGRITWCWDALQMSEKDIAYFSLSKCLSPTFSNQLSILTFAFLVSFGRKKIAKRVFCSKLVTAALSLSLSLSLSHSLNKWPCNLSQNFIKNHIFLGSAFSFSFYPSLCLSICPYLWLLISNALSFKYIFPISVQCWHRMPNYPQLLSLFVLSVIFFPVFLCMIFQY